jgi:hypothetical protein
MLSMSSPINDRPTTKTHLGNVNTKEVHRLTLENANCQINEIIEAGHAVTFDPDTLIQAHAEQFDDCAYCFDFSSTLRKYS